MTSQNPFRPISLIQFALKVRQMGENSWWVYRYEIGRNGKLSQTSRIVFFGESEQEAERWIQRQQEEATIYRLSDN